MSESTIATRSEKYERAVSLFQDGNYEQAAQWLGESLLEESTSERWNDWATAKFLGGHPAEAEGGYRRALELEPGNVQAITNLGALLAGQERFSEAIPLLELSLSRGQSQDAEKTAQLLKACKEGMARAEQDRREIRRFCENFTKGLSLQTVSLDRVLFRLMTVEHQVQEFARRCEAIVEEVKVRTTPPLPELPTPIPEKMLPATATTVWEALESKPAGQTTKQMGSSFYRGENCNFNPYAADHELPNFCRDFVLKGHLPASKIISKSTRITAFGSCFAQNITAHLSRLGFNLSKDRAKEIYVSLMGEGMVNVYSLLQQFTWALGGEKPPENLWHGFDAQSFGYDENIRTLTRDVFLNTDVFILTLGLSEIWFDEVTGGIFWRAVPMKSYDASRHKFRVCSFAETKQALERMHAVITNHVPSARIVFTLSPISLAATFRPISCITANCASKAILKSALDEFLRDLGDEARSRVHYFPAFEIINELFPHRFAEDGRHLQDFIIPAVMSIFEAYYCETNLNPEEAERGLQNARRKSGELASTIQR